MRPGGVAAGGLGDALAAPAGAGVAWGEVMTRRPGGAGAPHCPQADAPALIGQPQFVQALTPGSCVAAQKTPDSSSVKRFPPVPPIVKGPFAARPPRRQGTDPPPPSQWPQPFAMDHVGCGAPRDVAPSSEAEAPAPIP